MRQGVACARRGHAAFWLRCVRCARITGMKTIQEINILEDAELQQQIVRWSFIVFGATAATAVSVYAAEQLPGGMLLRSLLMVVIVSVAVLPVHELLHAAAFKVLGPRNCKITFGFTNMFLYTRTNDVVLPAPRFVAVLLTPSVVLTIALLLWGCIAGDLGFGILAAGLHLSGCTGDLLMAALIQATPEATHVQDTETGCKLLSVE